MPVVTGRSARSNILYTLQPKNATRRDAGNGRFRNALWPLGHFRVLQIGEMGPKARIELATIRLQGGRSTIEPLRHAALRRRGPTTATTQIIQFNRWGCQGEGDKGPAPGVVDHQRSLRLISIPPRTRCVAARVCSSYGGRKELGFGRGDSEAKNERRAKTEQAASERRRLGTNTRGDTRKRSPKPLTRSRRKARVSALKAFAARTKITISATVSNGQSSTAGSSAFPAWRDSRR